MILQVATVALVTADLHKYDLNSICRVASHRDCLWSTLHLPGQIFLDFSFQYCQIDLGDVYTIRIGNFFFLLYYQQKQRKAETIVQEGLIHFHLQSIPFI